MQNIAGKRKARCVYEGLRMPTGTRCNSARSPDGGGGGGGVGPVGGMVRYLPS
jgi:hypothetical protein